MTTFIKMKLKKSDNQTKIDKYRAAANIGFENPIKFPSKREKKYSIGPETPKLCFN